MDAVFAAFAAPPASDALLLTTRPAGPAAAAGGLLVALDGVPLFTAAADALAPALEGSMLGLAVRSRRDAAAFHAACVAWAGRAVLFLGDKGSGKSTLAAHLGQPGRGTQPAADAAAYLGDEVTFVRFSDTAVVPFAKAATVKAGAFACFAETVTWRDPIRGPVRYVAAATAPPVAATPALLVFPRWDADRAGEDAEIVPVRPEDVALELVRQSFGGLGRAPRTLEIVARLATLPAYLIGYGSLDAASRAVARLVEAL